MMRALLFVLLVLGAGCASTLEVGERHYREGNHAGALKIWRGVPADDPTYPEVAARISAVEAEFDRLVVGYQQDAGVFEAEGRVAESILDYRLALKFQPDNEAALAHVQRLARELSERKKALWSDYERDVERRDLDAARESLARLRSLDPFDPEYVIEERQLHAALSVEWRMRRARIRAELAEEVVALIEAGREAFGEEQLELARTLWRRALLIDPENERVIAYIARAERQLENLDRVRATSNANGDD